MAANFIPNYCQEFSIRSISRNLIKEVGSLLDEMFPYNVHSSWVSSNSFGGQNESESSCKEQGISMGAVASLAFLFCGRMVWSNSLL